MLPRLAPMLAVPAEPFDPPQFGFEVKWNGIRVLAAVEHGGWRLWGSERGDYTTRYPESDVLRRLPAGTLVDGEWVALDDHGRPDLPRLLRRHGLTDPWRIRQARRWCPVCYVVFDLLYHAGRCLLREPLARRQEALAALCHQLDVAEVQWSAGVLNLPFPGEKPFAVWLAQKFSLLPRHSAMTLSCSTCSSIMPSATASRKRSRTALSEQ
jgi:ATP-dependent DNA ligase